MLSCSSMCVYLYSVQYFSVLLIAFVGLVAGTAVAVVYRGRISDTLHDALKDGLSKYDNDTGCQEAVDLMQSQVC